MSFANCVSFIGIFLSAYVFIEGYNLISNQRTFNFGIKNFLLLIIMSFFLSINIYFNNFINKAIISLFIILLFSKIIFKEETRYAIIKTLICYAIIVIYELIFSIFIYKILNINFMEFSNHYLYKFLFSVIIMLISLITFKTVYIKKIINIINKSAYQNILNVFAMLSFNIGIIYMVTKYSIDFSSKTYFLNLVLLVIFLLLISISIFNSIKRQHELEKIDALLDFISKYEKIIDEDRMHKHELLNNLLILKSYKNSKEYKIALNDLIDTYDSNKNISIKNICKLPAGLKGIIYYKIKNSNCEKLRTQIHITKEASLLLENLEQKKYTSLCKIFCIHLDNSLEASINSKEKELFISIYKENTYIVIEIENTFQDKIDLKMIYKEKYSTKENSRGIGLFIAKLIEKNNKNITTSNIVVNDMFISQIKIKVD